MDDWGCFWALVILVLGAVILAGVVSTLIWMMSLLGALALAVFLLLLPFLIRGFRQGWREERKAEHSKPKV